MKRKTMTFSLAGRDITFETGKIAKQAGGSVLVHCGETTVLATACSSTSVDESIDFFPLRVDYQEKFSSVGRTLGGFIKREGKPSNQDILTSRLIDRGLRPLFEDGYYNEVQVFSYVYSFDGIHSPDILGICAASAALVISDIPLTKPLGAVRVAMIEGKFIVNPTIEEQKKSRLDLVMSGTEDAILMIEGYCDFLSEEQVLQAIDCGHEAIRLLCSKLRTWQEEVGKTKAKESLYHIPEEVEKACEKLCLSSLKEALTIKDKKQREKAFQEIQKNFFTTFLEVENPSFTKKDLSLAFKNLSSSLMRKMILEDHRRIDGRKLDEIRPIDIEQGLLPRTHGSSLFTRGETQALAVCTLGGENMAQRYEDLHGEGTHRFYLQYFFPPFSVGEVGRSGPPGRREIGHGKLAERALAATLPKQEDFPYVIRLESNITESNGSSSMASVCGGCLALMDAGVPIHRPVAGIAMGLILEEKRFAILSDILGDEDALGDMDFKLAGDEEGITAFQMDIKVEGITKEIMREALMQAKKGRSHIFKKMLEACPKSKQMSIHAPRIINLRIKPSQIGTVIGPGGKQIRAIQEFGVEIDISDDGIVSITSSSEEAMEKAKEVIYGLTAEVEIGKIYKGKITGIKPFGVFVELVGGKEGLCHISELSHARIDDPSKLFREGDTLEVKVLDINDRGQVKLSHKVLLKKV